jgi:hypothetical protein
MLEQGLTETTGQLLAAAQRRSVVSDWLVGEADVEERINPRYLAGISASLSNR